MLECEAARIQRALPTAGIFGHTLQGTKLHDGLVVFIRNRFWDNLVGQHSEGSFSLRTTDIRGYSEVSGQHPENVPVHYGHFFTKGERGNCRRCITSHTL